MNRKLKDSIKRVLPAQVFFLYHSIRAARKLGIIGEMFATLRNAGQKARYGGEAGWNIPRDLLDRNSVCYCIGCGLDISFDLAIIEKYGCAVHAFDPTPRSVEYVKRVTANVPKFTLHEVAIWEGPGTVKFYLPPKGVSHSITNLEGTDKFIEVPADRLKNLHARLGHGAVALLKMDIEGAEHTVIRTVLEDRMPVEVLCVEFDELAHATPERLASIRKTIAALREAGYDYFWIEGSNFTFRRRAAATR